MKSIRVKAGFRVELVACEPLVTDPVAFDWSADGRLWVVEMGDYPLGEDGEGKPGGRVRVLEDTDGDGKYDKSTVFLDGLIYPNGVMCWRDGVLISAAPEILYAEDTDGDGKADKKAVLFTGFKEANPQHRVNGFVLGLDGWAYGADGDSAEGVKSGKTGEVVAFHGRDFRFDPDAGRIEAESGRGQFGRQRNDWGNWFADNNSVWAWHVVLDDTDLRRNPSLAVASPTRVLETNRRLYPVSRTLPRFNDFNQANHVTSGNSPSPYRDELLGPGSERNLFVSEPVHNLVHRMVLKPDGATWIGERAVGEEVSEFLASSDHWFRPTQIKTGPDGALWVADMYRFVIEHPEWIPDDWEARLDLRAGHDMGRIYRVFPVGSSPRAIPRLDRLDGAGLVAAMDSPNGWVRDTCQRLLIHRGEKAVAPALARLVKEAKHPQARVQALATLDCLGMLEGSPVASALEDGNPEVRRFAAERAGKLAKDADEVASALLRLAEDPEVRVRFGAALGLGDWDDPRAGEALGRLLARDGDDPWLRTAALSSARPQAATIVSVLFAELGTKPPRAAVLEPLMGTLVANRDPKAIRRLLDAIVTPGPDQSFADWQLAAWAAFRASFERLPAEVRKTIIEHTSSGSQIAELTPEAKLWTAILQIIADEKAPVHRRVLAVRALRSDEYSDEIRRLLGGLLRAQESPEVREAAVDALARSKDPKVAGTLLDGWKGYTPALRATVLDAIASRPAWAATLLSSLEDTCIPPREIGPTQRRRLLENADRSIRERARAVFAGTDANRQQVIDRYRAAIAEQAGDPVHGAEVFKKTCATCHRLQSEGVEVGPDIASLTDRSREAMLASILDPNRSVEPTFAEYSVETADGRILTGLIAAETSNNVTLRRQEGKEDVLLRSEIAAMAASGRSLMPEGMENDLSPKDVADVIAYVSASGPPPKRLEGNKPEVVKPLENESIVLRASQAEIYGSSLTIEARYGNLGYWGAEDDRAAWEFDVATPGTYELWLDWACPDANAGNRYAIVVNGQRIEGKVGGTGTWDNYRRAKVGEVRLEKGRARLEVFAEGKIRGGALMDLRAIEVSPQRAPKGTEDAESQDRGAGRGCCD